MSWNKVYDLFIDIKKEIGVNFNTTTPIKDLIAKYCRDDYQKMCEPLEFVQYGNLLLIRYGRYSNVFNGESEYEYTDFWDLYDGLYQECRSLVIDIVNEDIVLSPFKKFRNLNECKETSLENIKNKIVKAKSVEVSNKLDGSMQSARWYNNQLIMSGSQSLDKDSSWRLQDGYNMLSSASNYLEMLKTHPKYTFIFEYISLKDAHCVVYTKEEEGLYLVGIRDSISGVQLSYKDVVDMANKFSVRTTTLYNMNLDDVLDSLSKYKSNEKEGYVLNIDGFMVKVKCDDYVNIHNILSKVSSVNVVIKSIADDTFDDLISKVPTLYRDRVMDTATIVFDYLRKTDDKVNQYYKEAPKDNIGTFMKWVTDYVPNYYQSYVRNVYKGIDNNYIKGGSETCPSYKKINEIKSTTF